MGMILGAMPSGSSEKPTLQVRRPFSAARVSLLCPSFTSASQASLNGTTVEQKALFPHTDTAACVGCKVLAFGSDADTIWPAVLVPRWQDVTEVSRDVDTRQHACLGTYVEASVVGMMLGVILTRLKLYAAGRLSFHTISRRRTSCFDVSSDCNGTNFRRTGCRYSAIA